MHGYKLPETLHRALKFDSLKVFTGTHALTNSSFLIIVNSHKKGKFGISEALSPEGLNLIIHCEEIYHLNTLWLDNLFMPMEWANCFKQCKTVCPSQSVFRKVCLLPLPTAVSSVPQLCSVFAIFPNLRWKRSLSRVFQLSLSSH